MNIASEVELHMKKIVRRINRKLPDRIRMVGSAADAGGAGNAIRCGPPKTAPKILNAVIRTGGAVESVFADSGAGLTICSPRKSTGQRG